MSTRTDHGTDTCGFVTEEESGVRQILPRSMDDVRDLPEPDLSAVGEWEWRPREPRPMGLAFAFVLAATFSVVLVGVAVWVAR